MVCIWFVVNPLVVPMASAAASSAAPSRVFVTIARDQSSTPPAAERITIPDRPKIIAALPPFAPSKRFVQRTADRPSSPNACTLTPLNKAFPDPDDKNGRVNFWCCRHSRLEGVSGFRRQNFAALLGPGLAACLKLR